MQRALLPYRTLIALDIALALPSVGEIAAHNARVSSWTAGLNEFSDMSWEEFQQRQLMAPQDCSATHTSTGWVPPQGASIPSSIDWRAKGAVNAIK